MSKGFEIIRFSSHGETMSYSYTESLEEAHKTAKQALKGGTEGMMKKAAYVGIVNLDTGVQRLVVLNKKTKELESKLV